MVKEVVVLDQSKVATNAKIGDRLSIQWSTEVSDNRHLGKWRLETTKVKKLEMIREVYEMMFQLI